MSIDDLHLNIESRTERIRLDNGLFVELLIERSYTNCKTDDATVPHIVRGRLRLPRDGWALHPDLCFSPAFTCLTQSLVKNWGYLDEERGDWKERGEWRELWTQTTAPTWRMAFSMMVSKLALEIANLNTILENTRT